MNSSSLPKVVVLAACFAVFGCINPVSVIGQNNSDSASSDAGPECNTSADCPTGGPDLCNVCATPWNHFVCSNGRCECACQVPPDGGVVDAGSTPDASAPDAGPRQSCNDLSPCSPGFVCENLDGGVSLNGGPGVCVPTVGSACFVTSDCATGGVDVCNICAAPQNQVICDMGTCQCQCQAPQTTCGYVALIPNPVDFPAISVGTSETTSVMIANQGTVSVAVGNITTQGSAFSVSFTGPMPLALSPGQAVSVTVQFTASSPLGSTGSLVVTYMASDPNCAAQNATAPLIGNSK